MTLDRPGSIPFTEGSWRVSWETDTDGSTCFDILKNDGDADDYGRMVDASYSIIEGARPILESDDENRANANLIASAPDLYEALKTLMIFIEVHNVTPSKGADMRRFSRLLRNGGSALAYARGESPDWGDDDAR